MDFKMLRDRVDRLADHGVIDNIEKRELYRRIESKERGDNEQWWNPHQGAEDSLEARDERLD